MKICTDVDLGDVIMDVKFKFEKFRDFDVIGGQSLPLTLHVGLTTATYALPVKTDRGETSPLISACAWNQLAAANSDLAACLLVSDSRSSQCQISYFTTKYNVPTMYVRRKYVSLLLFSNCELMQGHRSH